jgi:hypothetical protein
MHLLHLFFDNAKENGSGEMRFAKDVSRIEKWSLLPSGEKGRELLRLAAAAFGGRNLFPKCLLALRNLQGDPERPLHIEFIIAVHPHNGTRPDQAHLSGSGVHMDGSGEIRRLSPVESHRLPAGLPTHRAKIGPGGSSYFFLGYGPLQCRHDKTDDFDYNDPLFRLSRFHSLFIADAPLTDPAAFLARVHKRAVGFGRRAPLHLLERLARLFKEHLAIDTDGWMKKECDFGWHWEALDSWQRNAALPALDAARHLHHGFQTSLRPLDTPTLILFDRPDRLYRGGLFPRWVRLMDALFPKTQFIATVADEARPDFPETDFLQLPLPTAPPKAVPAKAQKGAILLLDGDGVLPNVALMKLSRHFKEQGKKVVLARHEAFLPGVEAAYASFIFNRPVTQARLGRLRHYYGDAFSAGGSGIDLSLRLPCEIESLPADYTLYPGLEDRAIGFLTRGCPFRCPFCVVPTKEGGTRQVADLDDLLPPGVRKLILLDDNILAHPRAGDFLEEMALRNLSVNFCQTLDLRLLDHEKARLIKRVHCTNILFTRAAYHFSLNDSRNLDEVAEKYRHFGFTSKDNVEFVCMYGFDTTLAQDVERFRFLRSLPGAYVFMQQYQPVPGGPQADHADFLDERADDLIDQLVRICFTQNMKSMEKYYRWVSKRYAQTFGRIHEALVDTIFKYNKRQERGRYLAALARRWG